MTKVRVYELAKEYGMKGPELATMLKEYGFEKVKSHMAVLDDATELQARGVLEAQGLKPSAPASAKPAGGGLRKKGLPPAGGASGSSATAASTDAPSGSSAAPAKPSLTDSSELEMEADGASGLPKKKALPPPAARKALPRKQLPESGDDEPVSKPAPAASPAPAAKTEPETKQAPAEKPVAEKPVAEKSVAEKSAPAAKPAASESVTPEVKAPEAAAQKPQQAPAAGVTPAAAAPDKTAAPDKAPGAKAPESKPAAATPAAGAPAAGAPAAGAPAAGGTTPTPAQPAAAAAKGGAAPAAGAPAAGGTPAKEPVKKLLVPERRAKVVGRIDLPQEAISDAKRRSAPSTGRNPGGVDRNLRQAALRNTQSRSALRSGPRSGGRGGPPGQRRGPGAGGRGRPDGRGRKGRGNQTSLAATVDPNKIVEIEPPTTVKGLSEALGVKVTDLIYALTFKLGVAGKTINSFLTPDEVELVALEVNRKIKIVERKEAEEELLQSLTEAAEGETSIARAPVITFMGHVDHGKTTLLDTLRSSTVVKGEAGGITQHVGAYKIHRENGTQFVILDTPGHEAFTQMRVRGAKLTDIVVLVVAADDGVMPQTEEAIAHAKEAKVPIVVAINKCDRPQANSMQVMQQLSVKGLQPESWGGDIQCVEVSALTGKGIDELADAIMLQAEILELDAKPDAAGEGIVIESKQSPEQGVVVNVLVTNGTLRLKDQILCGEGLSRVRGIIDDHGKQVKEVGPSTPVSLLGMTSLPMPGDKLFVIQDKKKAKEVVEDRQRQARNMSLAERSAQTKVTLENLSDALSQQKVDEVKVILKADVMGSLEPIKASLDRIATDEVRVNIIHSALGGITESDVVLAEAGGAMVIGFNTVADQAARQAADRANVEIRYYSIIYELIDEMKLAMEGMLRPEEVEDVTGHAEIKAIFRSSKIGNIAGLMVTDGSVNRNSHVRLSRDGRVVHTGKVGTLRREKDDVREVRGGYECGLTVDGYNDIKVGDLLEFYDVNYVKRTLS